jgi:transmembrane sensor
MKDFRLYDITDFVMDDDFIRWVQYKNEADIQFWSKWLEQNPGKHLIIAESKKILESLYIEVPHTSENDIDFEVNRLMSTISQNLADPKPKSAFISIKKNWLFAAAATLFIALIGGWFFTQKPGASSTINYATLTESQQLIEQINTSDRNLLLHLPDGSSVELYPGSKISYAKDFETNSTRDVYMTGEVFFNVVKNPENPFRVFANEIMTKVLGTSFVVRSFEKDSIIKVTVRTGKVSVYAQNESTNKETKAPHSLGGIIVTCNQQLVYEKAPQKFKKILSENPLMVRPPVSDQVFDEAPLEYVFNQLSKDYGVWIMYDAEEIKACTVTADLTKENFYQKLDLICRAVGISYELIDGQVVIQSKGCK